ncbi:MAG: pilin [bacterium]|nr:pilin [bacterium]
MKKIATSAAVAANTMLLTASVALAQTVDLRPNQASGFSSLGTLTPEKLIPMLIKLLLIVAALVFFFMLVLGGIKWILSGGDKGKTEEARNQITSALVGLVIVFSAWAIAGLIKAFFGVDILNLNLNLSA